MPFKETCRMKERIRMLSEYDTGNWSISDLCRRYGICRDTFYEWRKRREGDTAEWFVDHSHAPLHCPHRTEAAISEAVISLRRRFPHLGPRKLRVVLERQAPETCWPAASTIGDILQRAGLITPVKRRRPALDGRRSVTAVTAANDEWAADFKGWFRAGDNSRIDPLTLTDSHSRYLIEVRIVPPTIERSQPVFAAAFRRQGLPCAIRCDNGSPFGSTGAGGLTRLSAWWIKLGIEPHFIHPASPQENGRHERMHRTLREDAANPPAGTLAEQQRRFDAFRAVFNHERPHEALEFATPASLYIASDRAYPRALREPDYPDDCAVRRVRSRGEIKWAGELIFVSEALIGEPVAIEETEEGELLLRYADVELGYIDKSGRLRRRKLARPQACGLVDNAARCPQGPQPQQQQQPT